MSLQTKIQELRQITLRRDATFAADFEAKLTELIALSDPKSIAPLLEFFEDDAPFDELLFSIVHGIESHPDDVYVRELLAGSDALLRRSPRWSSILYMRVLNSDSARAELARALHSQTRTTQLAVRHILEAIEKRRPEFKPKVQEIPI